MSISSSMRSHQTSVGRVVRRAIGALLIALLVLLPGMALAEAPLEVLQRGATPAKYFKYVSDSDVATITGYIGPKSIKKIVIPSELDGYRVVGIGSEAFLDQRHIKSVKLPTGIESIDEWAFAGCSSLASINMPSSITDIGMFAFASCKKLKSMTIPEKVVVIEACTFYDCTSLNSLSIKGQIEIIGPEAFARCAFTKITITSKVKMIGTAAFSGCKKLKKINVVADNPYYSSEAGILFNKDKTALLLCPAANTISNYKLPASVRGIGHSAFLNCKNLKSITMGDQVTSIYPFAFSGCTKLKSVTLSNKLKAIESCVFEGCKSLAKIEIPEGVASIDMMALADCARNMQVYLPRSLVNFPTDFAADFLFPDKATLHVYTNSVSHQFAISKGYKYVLR